MRKLKIRELRVLYQRGKKWLEAEEDCIMRSLVTCTLHQTLLG
jgi:hypothetical protein